MSLNELAERCEQATGANFRLEQDIGNALFPERGHAKHPPYTASLDVAMTLLDAGCRIRLDRYFIAEEARWMGAVAIGATPDRPGRVYECLDATTPALAICAAILRAHASEGARVMRADLDNDPGLSGFLSSRLDHNVNPYPEEMLSNQDDAVGPRPTTQALAKGAATVPISSSFAPSPGRMFVCGDIHGCVDALMVQLQLLGFSTETDTLFALGDLVDRGLQNVEALALLDEPWFKSVKGNHEVLMEQAFAGNSQVHLNNGGRWFAELDEDTQRALVAKVRDLPIALTVVTPSGRRIGLVHADLPGYDWDDFISELGTKQVQDYAMWSRDRVGNAKHGREITPIRGVDQVYFGHTPMKSPLRAANISWIDTGCFATGRLTVEELL
jgi:serine/threonine protein phosphatase 1